MEATILTVEIRYEQDVVLARQRSRQITELLGFDARDQARVATAVSEIARNAFQYAGGGRVEFRVEGEASQQLIILVRDQGKGIPNLQAILDGQYHSSTGMGLGIVGTQRLMDEFQIESDLDGTTVVMSKPFPRRAPVLTPDRLAQVTQELMRRSPQNPYEEIQQQNQELLRALEELRKREDQLSQLNRELEDTNRGVVALYAELDEKATSLQKANEIKTRFISNMSHEFRTPVNSILSLTRLMLDRLDGDLTPEQEKQVNYIRKSAEALSDLVNDLLDLAKVEAGKVEVRPTRFHVSELFGTLRGMLRPLLGNPAVSLVFEEPIDLPSLHTDDGKVAQILRNFISNSLKFTERGEVRVSAIQQGDQIQFFVTDTGIGIAPQDLDRIFEDFVQLDSPQQRKVKGTGLGLPLSRSMAELLGGSVSVTSQLGVGSRFLATIPIVYPRSELSSTIGASLNAERTALTQPPIASQRSDPQPKLLLIDDDPLARYLLKQPLSNAPLTILEAESGQQGLSLAQIEQPQAIVLDLAMPEMNGFEVLDRLKQNPETCLIPVIIQTSHILEPAEWQRLANQTIAILSKDPSHKQPDRALREALTKAGLVLEVGMRYE